MVVYSLLCVPDCHPNKNSRKHPKLTMAQAFPAILVICLLAPPSWGTSFNPYDRLATVSRQLSATTADNCRQPNSVIYQPAEMVSQLPHYQPDADRLQPTNRTSLQYAYNVATSRAVFLSLIYNWTASANQWMSQPGFFYLYLSTAVNAQAGPRGVASSGLFFGPHRAYPNWIPWMSFNSTLPLFAIRARLVNDAPGKVVIKDLGLTEETNYTDVTKYPQNEFFERFSETERDSDAYPRIMRLNLHSDVATYNSMSFKLRRMDANGQTASYARPYFDCGQDNEWLVTLGSVAGERLARYSFWQHLRHYRNVAMSTVDVAFRDIDINTCPGADDYFADTAECPLGSDGRREVCRPKSGEGMSRNGIQCCEARYCPNLSRASDAILTVAAKRMDRLEKVPCTIPDRLLELGDRYWDYRDVADSYEVQGRAGLRLGMFFSAFLQLNNPDQQAQNRAYWQSAFSSFHGGLQAQPESSSPFHYLKGDQGLTLEHLQAEVYSTLLADGALMSVGIYLEPGHVTGVDASQPVAAFAWRKPGAAKDASSGFETEANVANLADVSPTNFTQLDWYQNLRARYSTMDTSLLKQYEVVAQARVSLNSGRKTLLDSPTLTYFTTDYNWGEWAGPHFTCNNLQREWLVSYSTPIYAMRPGASGRDGLQYVGIVKVDAKFSLIHVFERRR